MYTKHSNLVDAGASGGKASTKHPESRLEVIQGHTFWDHWKADDGLHRFRDIAVFLRSWPYPYSILILGVFPLYQIARIAVSLSRSLKLFGREIIFEALQPMWSR